MKIKMMIMMMVMMMMMMVMMMMMMTIVSAEQRPGLGEHVSSQKSRKHPVDACDSSPKNMGDTLTCIKQHEATYILKI